jgi:hypothetical protein
MGYGIRRMIGFDDDGSRSKSVGIGADILVAFREADRSQMALNRFAGGCTAR